ncbi:hypothetical protein ISS98_03795 [Dyella flagellata]
MRTSYLMVYAIGFGLIAAVQAPAFAQTNDDGYVAILSYLDSNTISGNVARGSQGISSVNTAAGDANQQANLHAFTLGGHAMALLQARQATHRNAAADAPLDASATIGGHAYANGQGIASINQVSGNGNTQLNGVAARLANQGIHEATDGSLSATVSASAGGQTSSNPHAQAGGTRSVAVDPSAMEGFNGVLQLNQVAGSGNASDNLVLLSAPASPH